jgi:15-cis-phytoene synthase
MASVRPGLEHAVAHARLSWWREECARCAQGTARHPLTRALAESLAAVPASLQGLSGLIDTASWDLAHATFETRRELSAYCTRWSTAMIEPLVRLAAPHDPTGASIGAPLRELELLSMLVPDARAGRVRLPLDELAAAQSTVETLTRSPLPRALAPLLHERHQTLRAQLSRALSAWPAARRAELRGLLVWVTLLCRRSRRCEQRLPSAALREEDRPLSAGWHAWRAARAAARGRNPLV